MADTRQDDLALEIRHVALHRIDLFAPETENAVAITRDKEGRLAELGPVEEGRQRPVAIDIAIIVETARETAALEFADQELYIRISHEGRFLRRRSQPYASHVLRFHRSSTGGSPDAE